MTLADLRLLALQQYGLEPEDLPDVQPGLDIYLNEGYHNMESRAYKQRVTETFAVEEGSIPFTALKRLPTRILDARREDGVPVLAWVDEEKRCVLTTLQEGTVTLRYRYLSRALEDPDDSPALPAIAHQALADWATWRLYTNGNPQKQNRGQSFRARYEEVLRTVRAMGSQEPGYGQMHGLYRDYPIV